jgi:lipopolysaccharide export system protein LptC
MTRRKVVSEAVAELLVSASVAERPTRHEWSARIREAPHNTQRYTRFVTLMKRALPIAAGILGATVLAYSFLPRQSDHVTVTYEQMGKIENDLAMLKPRLTGTDAKGNPFVITADAAIQDRKNTRRARLKNVEADISLDAQRWINAKASHGLFDMNAGQLDLDGGISVYSDSGYEIHTAKANVDLKKGFFRGPVEVKGQGPLGNFRADSFELRRQSRQILLTGHVQMTMYLPRAEAKK